MQIETLAEKARTLRALHRPGDPVVFFNAWDAVSARILEKLGVPAIATSSAAIAWAEGFADGQHISRERMLAGVERVTSAVRVPVTADAEGAYGLEVQDAAQTARGVIDAGAVGLNFEDAVTGGVDDIGHMCARIAAMAETGQQLGVPLLINARTDVFLDRIGPDDAWRLNEAIERGKRFLQAGAACIFVPGVSDERTIEALAKEIHGPLNVLANASTPPVRRLAELGVARVSVGGAAIAHALSHFRSAAAKTLADGTFEFTADRISHADLNALFVPKA
ncbi:MAG TPA: isocitrate lyase/phosphoenolpyruvate mutase family protein [Candidatus Baltobacteraceae bacterium]